MSVFIIRSGLLFLALAIAIGVIGAPTICAQQNASSAESPPGKRITFADGRTLEVEDAWKQGDLVWYRRGGVTQSVESRLVVIKSIPGKASEKTEVSTAQVNKAVKTIWIHLVGGASFTVDHVRETSAGAWYDREGLTAFLERDRIARIDLDRPLSGLRNRDWTSGNSNIDDLIRSNGTRFGVDPYLIFCVIEQESHFRTRAISPKGARGLMQLMPGTARRLGVKNSFDPAANIRGGTQYLRELMDLFAGQVSLVLASYNAGEGAVLKYGRSVPPYRETREYVKKISKRYGLSSRGEASQIGNQDF